MLLLLVDHWRDVHQATVLIAACRMSGDQKQVFFFHGNMQSASHFALFENRDERCDFVENSGQQNQKTPHPCVCQKTCQTHSRIFEN